MFRRCADAVARGSVLGILIGVFVLPLGAPRPVSAQGYLYVDHDAVRQCGGNTPCYTTIQAAVDAASPGDTVYVYPGNYPESVDLSRMDPDGDIRIVTVDAAGSMASGTATVGTGALSSTFHTTSPFDGDVSLMGFNTVAGHHDIEVEVQGAGSESRDIDIRNIVFGWAHMYHIRVIADGNVTIADCVGHGSGDSGILVQRAGGNVEITNCNLNTHFTSGINVWDVAGDVTISNCTVYHTGFAGIWVEDVLGYLIIRGCTSDYSEGPGLALEPAVAGTEVSGCLLRDNGYSGIDLYDEFGSGGEVQVHGSIFCGNEPHGLSIGKSGYPVTTHAEGNWWGCAGGPDSANCDSVAKHGSQVDYTPWIDTISADTGGSPVVAGQPMVVKLRFSDSKGTVFLGPGPGDPNGPPPFTVSTDNGILNGEGSTVGGFIEGSDGALEVALVPERTGTATLTVVGPCGLEGEITLEGPQEFVPEPGTVLLLGSGLMGLAGYASLRLRKR